MQAQDATGKMIDLVIGDDYLTAHDRQLEWTVDKPTNFEPAGATCWFGVDLGPYTNQVLLVEGLIDDNGDTLTLNFEIPKAKTQGLKSGKCDWSVAIHDANGHEITSVRSGVNGVSLVEKFT